MSWTRFGDADVYTFPSEYQGVEGYECCGCSLAGGIFHTADVEVFLSHLDEHRKAGHYVPDIEREVRDWEATP